jgi:hypothetical protein
MKHAQRNTKYQTSGHGSPYSALRKFRKSSGWSDGYTAEARAFDRGLDQTRRLTGRADFPTLTLRLLNLTPQASVERTAALYGLSPPAHAQTCMPRSHASDGTPIV